MSCVLVHIGSHRLVIELPPCPWSTTGLQRPVPPRDTSHIPIHTHKHGRAGVVVCEAAEHAESASNATGHHRMRGCLARHSLGVPWTSRIGKPERKECEKGRLTVAQRCPGMSGLLFGSSGGSVGYLLVPLALRPSSRDPALISATRAYHRRRSLRPGC